MKFVDLNIAFKAKNSSGEQELFLTQYGEEFYFTLCGDYNGQKIQIDFDEITKEKLTELKTMIELILEADK